MRRGEEKIIVVKVKTPFPNVASYIIQAVAVRWILTHRGGISDIFIIVRFGIIARITPRIVLIGKPPACSIFPFSFCRKSFPSPQS